MNSYFNRGDFVRFTNCIDEQVKWGGNNDPRGVLKMDNLKWRWVLYQKKALNKLFLMFYLLLKKLKLLNFNLNLYERPPVKVAFFYFCR